MPPGHGQMTPGENHAPEQRRKRTAGTSTLEWIIASISFLVVAATIVFLLDEATDGQDSFPLIEIRTESVTPYEWGYIVELAVHNSGGATAAQLLVEGTLLDGDSAIQTSTVTLDYLPARSLRRAALIFTHDPNRYELRLRPSGFAYP